MCVLARLRQCLHGVFFVCLLIFLSSWQSDKRFFAIFTKTQICIDYIPPPVAGQWSAGAGLEPLAVLGCVSIQALCP